MTKNKNSYAEIQNYNSKKKIRENFGCLSDFECSAGTYCHNASDFSWKNDCRLKRTGIRNENGKIMGNYANLSNTPAWKKGDKNLDPDICLSGDYFREPTNERYGGCKCSNDAQCDPGYRCFQSTCINSCIKTGTNTDNCPNGFRCDNAKCVFDSSRLKIPLIPLIGKKN